MAFLSILVLFALIFSFPGASLAAIEEGKTTQGEFALWLVQEAGALSKLPPAASGQDAVDFLVSLGIAPEEGWDEDKPIDKKFLMSLLGGDEEDYTNLSFEELVRKVQDYLVSILSNRQLGVFRATSGASGSTPAG